MKIAMPPEILAQGRAEYERVKIDGDPVISPFYFAMLIDGFDVQTELRGSILRECPHCGEQHSGIHTKDGLAFWACPHCQRIDATQKDVLEIITVFSARLHDSRLRKNQKLLDGVKQAVKEAQSTPASHGSLKRSEQSSSLY